MIKSNSRIRIIQTYGIWFLDALCVVLAYYISISLPYRRGIFSGRLFLGSHILIAAEFILFALHFFPDWNRDYVSRGYLKELYAVVRLTLLLFAGVLIYIYFMKYSGYISRLFAMRFGIFFFMLSYAGHCLLKLYIRYRLRAEINVRKLFVIADRNIMEATLEKLTETMHYGTQIVGAVYADRERAEEGTLLDGQVKLLGNMDDLEGRIVRIPFDEVFVNTRTLSYEQVMGLILRFEEMGVICHYNVDLPEMGGLISTVGRLGGFSVVSYHKNFYSTKKLMIKRAIDMAGSLVGIIFTGIATIFITPAIKLDSEGPVFYSQVRVGKNGRRFRIYKFRSMYKDADARLKDLLDKNEVEGPMFKIEDDPRITKVGKFLRRTSLDEFPQFLNVFKGDMSLVGTRPPTEREFEEYNEYYRRRLSMTPGITGLWQISGRSDIQDFEEVMKLDLEYIDNWSLTLDLKILLKTFVVVLKGRGAA